MADEDQPSALDRLKGAFQGFYAGMPNEGASGDLVGKAATGLATLPQRAIQNSQYSLETGNYDPAVPVEAAMTAMTGGVAGTGPKGVALGSGPIRAYHGSPHDFDRFDLSKVGTGEGAQAYGHGLYFADSEKVARGYRDRLSPGYDLRVNGGEYNSSDPAHLAAMNLDTFGKRGKTRQEIADILRRDAHLGERYGQAADLLQSGAQLPHFERGPSGKMYEVDINADPAHMLDWDRPLREQPIAGQIPSRWLDETRKEAQSRAYGATSKNRSDQLWGMVKDPLDAPGEFLINSRKHYEAPEISRSLNEAGIPGIKYLDAGSRNVPANRASLEADIAKATASGDDALRAHYQRYLDRLQQPSSNYVVFDPNKIDIRKKYGLAGASMLPPAAAGLLQPSEAKAENMADEKEPKPQGGIETKTPGAEAAEGKQPGAPGNISIPGGLAQFLVKFMKANPDIAREISTRMNAVIHGQQLQGLKAATTGGIPGQAPPAMGAGSPPMAGQPQPMPASNAAPMRPPGLPNGAQ